MKKVVLLSIILAVMVSGCSLSLNKNKKVVLKPEEAKAKAETFINEKLMKPGSNAKVTEVVDEGALYKVTVDVGSGQNITSYITKDGTQFFPQVINMDEKTADEAKTDETATDAQAPSVTVATKNDKPVVEMFIMSHCPYGTQIEKGMLPVVETLGDKIDFQLKFVNYAMHGEKEVYEQLNQYCINKNEPQKFNAYLKCFLEEGNGEACLGTNKIDVGDMKACTKEADTKFDITKNLNDKTTWKGSFPPFKIYEAENVKYGVSGSPTLVINGENISAGRDSNSLMKAICSAFNTQPEECNNNLPQTTPAPGFGFDGGGNNTNNATCN